MLTPPRLNHKRLHLQHLQVSLDFWHFSSPVWRYVCYLNHAYWWKYWTVSNWTPDFMYVTWVLALINIGNSLSLYSSPGLISSTFSFVALSIFCHLTSPCLETTYSIIERRYKPYIFIQLLVINLINYHHYILYIIIIIYMNYNLKFP